MTGNQVSPSLVERVRAAESTITRFSGAPLVWGETDCLRLIAHGLRELGRTPPLRKAGAYSSHLGAHRALRRTGFATLQDWVTSWGLTPIAPALTLPADVVALPSGDDAMPSLALVLSNGLLLGFVPEVESACVFELRQPVILKAWAV